MRRRVRRTAAVVQSLGVTLRVPLHRVLREAGRMVVDRQSPVTRLDDDAIAGEVPLGVQKVIVVLERDDAGHLVALVHFADREVDR